MEHNLYQQRCDEGRPGGFRHFMPFLILPIAIVMLRGMARHRFAHIQGMHMQGMHREGWKGGVPPMFAELHRRAHAAEEQIPAGTLA